MKIHLTSVFVDDQARAEQFYTGILGFVKKHDVPVGEKDQELMLITRRGDGYEERRVQPVVFVPMTGEVRR